MPCVRVRGCELVGVGGWAGNVRYYTGIMGCTPEGGRLVVELS